MKHLSLGLVGIGFAAIVAPAFAHHSFAMFDPDKKSTIEGTVKEFQWANPHSWIIVMVPNAQGVSEQWNLEMGPPAGLAREGWTPKTLTPGLKITTVIHPLKDGSNGGQFVSVTLPDGKVLGNQGGITNGATGTN